MIAVNSRMERKISLIFVWYINLQIFKTMMLLGVFIFLEIIFVFKDLYVYAYKVNLCHLIYQCIQKYRGFFVSKYKVKNKKAPLKYINCIYVSMYFNGAFLFLTLYLLTKKHHWNTYWHKYNWYISACASLATTLHLDHRCSNIDLL